MGSSMKLSRLLVTCGVFALGVAGGFWGRGGSLPLATAALPQEHKAASDKSVATANFESSDYSRRAVAYIYDTIQITREDLGEYLITRFGADAIGKLVNLRIVELAAKEKGIEVTQADVDAHVSAMIKSLNVTRDQFVDSVLKPRGTNLVAFKQDVVRPEMMLTKLCRERAVVTDEELRNAFEAYYGEKLEARMILWPKNERNVAMALYPKIRDSEEEFDRAAKQQATPELAANGGKMEPFGRHTSGNEEMERSVFRLKPGEISSVISTPEGFVVLKCVKHIPPVADKKLDDVKDSLRADILKRKIEQQEIPKLCGELREKARPKIVLNEGQSSEETIRRVKHEVEAVSGPGSQPEKK